MTGALCGNDQVDVLGPERGAGLDLRLDVAGQVAEFVRIDFQLQLRKVRAGRIGIGLNIRSTSPIWTPRNFTFASSSMTKPARSEMTVSGTVVLSVPSNAIAVSVLIATITRMRTGAHQIGSIPRRRRVSWLISSPRQVEVAGLSVYRQRDGQQNENSGGDRGAHRATDRFADAGRSAGGVVAVVRVNCHHRSRHR